MTGRLELSHSTGVRSVDDPSSGMRVPAPSSGLAVPVPSFIDI